MTREIPLRKNHGKYSPSWAPPAQATVCRALHAPEDPFRGYVRPVFFAFFAFTVTNISQSAMNIQDIGLAESFPQGEHDIFGSFSLLA